MHRLDSKTIWDRESQRNFWNEWISENLPAASPRPDALRTAHRVLAAIAALGLPPQAAILEVGCANGWFGQHLTAFGQVTGIDLADSAVAEARKRVPEARFETGDFIHAALPEQSFDVLVSLETFAHVDQDAFLEKAARVLKPGGHLILTTQNRFAYMRMSWVKPPAEGQLRRWVTVRQLKRMVETRFRVRRCVTVEPEGNRGVLRLVNSRKVNAFAGGIVGRARLERWKELAGFGQTILLVAQVKAR
jgi:2-polyprenyl-3-methyl-5-hydroxy-6-metoxy-1,4-benzoquinol methylase